MRKIIHVDMDAFYAQVEQRDNPNLQGKAVVVGGDPYHRGVVATCSYEARKYGVHSALSCKEAYRLCPDAIFIRPRFEVYKEVSRQIGDIFRRYTEQVEFLSLDEAFLDITDNKVGQPSATRLAQQIKKDIFEELHLTASAGVSYNKFLAKVASDYHKPNGLKVITPDEAEAFIDDLPVDKFFLVGKVTAKTLHALGIYYGRDLKKLELQDLISLFNKKGQILYDFARGIDHRKVEANHKRKSVGAETTLKEDMNLNSPEAREVLERLAREVSHRVTKRGVWGKQVTLKVKFSDFSQLTRTMGALYPIRKDTLILEYIDQLLQKVEEEGQKVRLLGITLSDLVDEKEKAEETISVFEYLDQNLHLHPTNR